MHLLSKESLDVCSFFSFPLLAIGYMENVNETESWPLHSFWITVLVINDEKHNAEISYDKTINCCVPEKSFCKLYHVLVAQCLQIKKN